MKKSFKQIEQDLQRDGALRDFYIHNTTTSDWDRLIKFVIPKLENGCFWVEGESTEIPSSFQKIDAIRQERSVFLDIPVGGKYLRCHFFSAEMIELDFWPQDYCDQDRWNALCGFLQDLVDVIEKTGMITFENEFESTNPIKQFKPKSRTRG